jgi:2-polyprenyl-6-methoxyphenol hydroxylase-like FAD-dependent oxidoreductase
VWLYPQNDVFDDLAARREADGGDVRYSCSNTDVYDLLGTPKVYFTDADGTDFELRAQILVGADGSRSYCRHQIPEASRKTYFNAYPFAWFGILTDAPRSSPELIYANSAHGFALISQRTDTEVHDLLDKPRVHFTDSEGNDFELRAEILVGADGSRSYCRHQIPEAARKTYFNEYPFAWFGILTEAPRSAPELIYANSAHGFALISQRTDTVQRMYFQCDPTTNPADWTDEQIWEQLRLRVNGNGFELKEGPVTDKVVLPFRSFVQTPMRHGNLFLAGDAAHTVPPTGAKGLNLAFSDVRVLFESLDSYFKSGSTALMDTYSDRALDRVWKAQYFSYWMTTLLHTVPTESNHEFFRARQLGELRSLLESERGRAYIAECYTGWQSK